MNEQEIEAQVTRFKEQLEAGGDGPDFYQVTGIIDTVASTVEVQLSDYPEVRVVLHTLNQEASEETAEAYMWLLMNLPEVLAGLQDQLKETYETR